jgi:hypothetical protein
MDPHGRATRPTPMRRFALTLAALTLPVALAACGSDDSGDDTATDPAPTAAPSPTGASSPTASPTVGTYPEFAPTDYTYTLAVQCFCLYGGAPIEVTVEGGEVTEAVYGEDQDTSGRGNPTPGDPVDESLRLTINDVIAQANDTTAEKVTVDWPAGQDHPNEVRVDGSKGVADDEAVYTVSDVQVG